MVKSLEFEFGADGSTYCDRGAEEVVSRVRCLPVHAQPQTLPGVGLSVWVAGFMSMQGLVIKVAGFAFNACWSMLCPARFLV